MIYTITTLLFLFLLGLAKAQPDQFVRVVGQQFNLQGQSYSFIGANYRYGGLLGNDSAGRRRLVEELDFLHSKVTIDKSDLAFVNEELQTVTEAGQFNLMIGDKKPGL